MTEQNKQSADATAKISALIKDCTKTAIATIPREQFGSIYAGESGALAGANVVRICAAAYVPVLEMMGGIIGKDRQNEAACMLMLDIAKVAIGSAHELRSQMRGIQGMSGTDLRVAQAEARLSEAVLHMLWAAGDIDDRVFGGSLLGESA